MISQMGKPSSVIWWMTLEFVDLIKVRQPMYYTDDDSKFKMVEPQYSYAINYSTSIYYYDMKNYDKKCID